MLIFKRSKYRLILYKKKSAINFILSDDMWKMKIILKKFSKPHAVWSKTHIWMVSEYCTRSNLLRSSDDNTYKRAIVCGVCVLIGVVRLFIDRSVFVAYIHQPEPLSPNYYFTVRWKYLWKKTNYNYNKTTRKKYNRFSSVDNFS